MLPIKNKILLADSINLDIYEGNKVVSFSGGTDSTLLLYLLLKYCTDDLIVVSRIFPYQHAKNLELVTRLFHRVTSLAGRRNAYQVLVHEPTSELNYTQLRKKFSIDVFYTGMTLNPPKEVYSLWEVNPIYPLPESIRDPDELLKSLIYDHNGILCYSPFINHNKKIIKKIYEDEDLMTSIFPYTNSCTDDFSPNLYHCGECWWCKERQWGFGKI